MVTSAKAIPGEATLRRLFQRIREGAGFLLPRGLTEAEAQARRRPDDAQQRRGRALVERAQTQFKERARALAGRLADGDLTPREMRAHFLTELRFLLLTSAAATAGGIGQLKPADIQRVDDEVAKQARYLDNWMAQVERMPVEARSRGQMETRAQMYSGSATRLAAETLDRTLFGEWPDMPFYEADRTRCRNLCACGWRWHILDEAKGDADVYWEVNYTRTVETEHCEECLNRREAFYPLKIRNWQFVNLPADLSPFLFD